MSLLRFVSRGEVNVLDRYLAGDMTLHLFKLDVEAGLTEEQLEQLVAADFTEATFPGYAAVTLTGGTWSTLASDPSRATFAEQSFTRSSTGTAQLIHGYYVTDDLDAGSLAFYEQFDGPISIEFLNDQLDVTPQITLDEGSSVPTGEITMHGSDTMPTGYLLCDGSAVSRTTFAALFAEIGETWGAGDGSTTFNLPPFCGATGRFPFGKATSGTGSTLGETGGAIDHAHGLDTASSGALTRLNASSQTFRSDLKSVASWTETDAVTTNAGIAVAGGLTDAARLTGDTDTANPPFAAVNFKIKT